MLIFKKVSLATTFRGYTVSSYVLNFDSYTARAFEFLPSVRTVGNDEVVVVQARMLRTTDAALKLDYVMRRGLARWQGGDVLTDGSISRVAVQRADFRQLLASGGVPAPAEALSHRVANLSGGNGGIGDTPTGAADAP